MNPLETSASELSQLTAEVLRLAHSYWSSLDERSAYPATSGRQTHELFSRPWPDQGRRAGVLSDFELIAEHSRPSNAKFFGYVFGSGEPVGALGELLAAALNQNVTGWRSGPAAASIEHTVVGWLAEAVGCAGFSGSLCGGGSAANLMALAMAREAKCPANEDGVSPCIIYASEQVHMSIAKAVALLGIGRKNLRLIPVDGEYRLRTDLLKEAITRDRSAGKLPIAVVASAGTTNTGAIDPLADIAELARKERLWMHVDGAYGALACLAVPEKFCGIEFADSLSLDAHKWLYQTVDCGCILYRDRRVAQTTFAHSGDYLKALTADPIESFAFFEESAELSRRFRALKLWMSMNFHGREAFRAAIAEDLRHAQLLAQAIAASPHLELLAPVPLSSVCFRHRSKDNGEILRQVIRRGRVYFSNATIDGRFCLRACFVNHRTKDSDVLAIVSEVEAAAAEI
jgi:glutamate/tyrosine decarboxylase-like PLP-dependent enzyme